MSGASAFIGLQIRAETFDHRVYVGVVASIDSLQGLIRLVDAFEYTNQHKVQLGDYDLSRHTTKHLQVLSTTKSSTPGVNTPPSGSSSAGGGGKGGGEGGSNHSTPRREASQRFHSGGGAGPADEFGPSSHSILEDVYAVSALHQQPADESNEDDGPGKARRPRGGVRRNKKGKGGGNHEAEGSYEEEGRGSGGTGSGRSRGSGGHQQQQPHHHQQPQHQTQRQAFAEEFNFQANLDSFDKAKVFAQIRSQDDTDPASRLVAHNRNRQQVKLAPTENVLSEDELAEQRREATQQSSADETASDYGEEEIEERRAPPHKAVVDRERRGTIRPAGNGTPTGRAFVTPTGVKAVEVRLKQFREALSIADIETGPSPLQRTENAGRGIATFILQTLSRDRQLFPIDLRKRPAICLVCGDCDKGTVALRLGVHLSNHGCRVVTYILTTEDHSEVFRTNLRVFSSSGGRILRELEDVHGIGFDLIVDAIADNDVQASLEAKTTAELAAATWATSTGVPILSIDAPLGTDHDTGAPTTSSPLRPTYIVCRGAVRPGCRASNAEILLVDVGISPPLWSRVGVEDWDPATFGTEFVIPLVR